MQIITSHHNHFVLSFARGEELFATLLKWCDENHIAGAAFTGLGAADQLTVAYYDLESKTYEKHAVNEEVEILSLTGNVGTLKDEKMLHIHGVFGRRDLSTFGGHLFKIRISGACEIHMRAVPAELKRQYDAETGLNLLCP